MSSAIAVCVAFALAGTPEQVGIAWHAQATVEPRVQQRLANEVAERWGLVAETVIFDAVFAAQRVEAYRVELSAARESSDLQARVDLAVAQFRAGDLTAARRQADVVLRRLRHRPDLPGASALAWQLHTLRGRVAWTDADELEAAASWMAAVAIDPGARLSTRQVPPDVVASYETVRQGVLADRSRWSAPTFTGVDLRRAQVEIDGVAGMRSVPPGEHFVVVRWPGASAQAAVVDGDAMTLTEPDVVVPAGLPDSKRAAERICTRLKLDVLVLARVRGGRLGVQPYACGRGFGGPWYSAGSVGGEAWEELRARRWPDPRVEESRGVLLEDAPWPQTTEPAPDPDGPTSVPRPSDSSGREATPRPWFRRPAVWVALGGLVVGGVALGVWLGTRSSSSQVVVTDEFLRP